MDKITGRISGIGKVSGSILSGGTITGTLSWSGGIPVIPYEGEYTVIPSTSEQVLYTNGLLMEDNVTVTEIPYAEVSNIYGTTISIVS